MKNLLLLIVLSWNTEIILAQVTFEKSIGGSNYDSGVSSFQNASGKIVSASNTNNYGNSDIAISKMDSQGDTLWTKIFGGTGNDYCNAIQQASANEYIILGTTNNTAGGDYDIQLIKTDSNGVVLWSKTYGGVNNEGGLSIQCSTDNGYLIAGYTESFGAGMKDVFVLNVDINGGVNWNKAIGGLNNDVANSVNRTTDGGYIISGVTNSFNENGDEDVYLIKIDANGNKLWSKAIGGSGQDSGKSGLQTSDGGYMIVGKSTSFGSGDTDIYIIKTDSNGNVVFSKTLNSTAEDFANCIKQTSDGEYILVGVASSLSSITVGGSISGGMSGSVETNANVCLIKFNINGILTFVKNFGGASFDKGLDVFQTTDGAYIITGETNSYGAGNFDSYLIKTDNLGKTNCVSKEISLSENMVSSFCNLVGDTIFSSGIVPVNASPLLLNNFFSIASNCFQEVTDTVVVINDALVLDSRTEVFPMRSTLGDESYASNNFNFNVFPNPNDGNAINLSITSSKGEELLVVLRDALGREHFSKVVIAENDMEYVLALDLSEKLSPGIYFIVASSKIKCDTKKLIVK